jgi:hypothetical protein
MLVKILEFKWDMIGLDFHGDATPNSMGLFKVLEFGG